MCSLHCWIDADHFRMEQYLDNLVIKAVVVAASNKYLLCKDSIFDKHLDQNTKQTSLDANGWKTNTRERDSEIHSFQVPIKVRNILNLLALIKNSKIRLKLPQFFFTRFNVSTTFLSTNSQSSHYWGTSLVSCNHSEVYTKNRVKKLIEKGTRKLNSLSTVYIIGIYYFNSVFII